MKQQPTLLFGGVSVFLFGDILQLKPVKGRYIFEQPISESFLLAFLTGSLWKKFDVVILKHNHRQGEDKEYADILNRLRIGEVTEEDVKILEPESDLSTTLIYLIMHWWSLAEMQKSIKSMKKG